MLFSTPTQFAVLGLLLIAGWLFGLASHPGGKKWKARYVAERDAHAAARKDGDIRANAAEKRVAELERENARLLKAAPVAAPVVAPVASSTIAPTRADVVQTQSNVRPAYAADGTKRGWFDFGDRSVR